MNPLIKCLTCLVLIFYENGSLNFGGKTGPAEYQIWWPRGQIKWPWENGPVLKQKRSIYYLHNSK